MNNYIYKGTVCISDSQFRYAYLIETHIIDSQVDYIRLYFPTFSPESYDKHPTYFLNITYFDNSKEIPILLTIFDRSEALACAPIRNEKNIYYEYIDFCCHQTIPDIDRLYVSLTPVINTNGDDDDICPDMDYNSGQSALISNTSDVAAKFEINNNEISLIPVISGREIENFNDYLNLIYGEGEYFIQYHIFVADHENIYEAIESDIYPIGKNNWNAHIDSDIMTQFSNENNVETSHDRWKPGLKLTGTIVIYKSAVGPGAQYLDDGIVIIPIDDNEDIYEIKTDLTQINLLRGAPTSKGYDIEARSEDTYPPYKFIHKCVVKFAGIMTPPLPITQELYAQWCYNSNKEIIFNDNMEIIQPRIINKSINIVHEITSRTDPHSNIIQPTFFRVRDLANIVVHPEVTENICINLDAYKSQCTSFMLKIEGEIFQEKARVDAGVIFKIQSNILPGKVDSGIYYILNQNAELITTGKFYYER